jgi:hypothetical protein
VASVRRPDLLAMLLQRRNTGPAHVGDAVAMLHERCRPGGDC